MRDDPSRSASRLRFGDFEVDLESHELARAGRRIRLQEKSFLVLRELLARRGRVVSREELAAALWPKEYFVDAEHGLNTAVRRLREALGDSAESPRYVETLPRLGYRFLAAIEPAGSAPGESTERALPAPGGPPPDRPRVAWRGGLTVAAVAAVAVLAALAVRRAPPPEAGSGAATPAAGRAEMVEELLARSRYLRNTKRIDEARRFVEEALKLEPTNPDALAGLALNLLGERRDAEARATAQRALELDPRSWEAHRVMGSLARGAGDMRAAEHHLRRAVDANPTDHKSRNRLARHLLECGRFDEARAEMLETRRLAPDDPDVQNIWIDHALRTGDYEDAIRRGEIWMTIWGGQIRGASLLGVREALALAYVGARRYEDALAQFRALDAGDELRAALVLGYAGQTAEARALLAPHEAEADAGADPGRAGALAMAYVVLGDFDRAFAHLDRQLAAGWHPSWLHCALFRSIRDDRRWPGFARRLERDFFAGREHAVVPAIEAVRQLWPRNARPAAAAESG